MKVTLQDGRQMAGQMLAFDKVRLSLLIPSSQADRYVIAHESRPCRH